MADLLFTRHARARVGERVARMDPDAAQGIIAQAIRDGVAAQIATDVQRRAVFEVALPTGQWVFPVLRDNRVITVLSEGHDVTTSTGRMALHRRGLPAGVHRAIPAAVYHADPCPEPGLASTLAKTMLAQSPLHAWTASPRLNPDWQPTEKKAFDIGRAGHRAVLGAGDDWEVIPDGLRSEDGGVRSKAARTEVEAIRARGHTPLKSEEADAIRAMAQVLRARLADNRITLDTAQSEVCAIARIDDVWCRAMIDNAPADPSLPLYDFKTTTDAAPDACLRACLNYGYDVQAAHYRETWRAATGEDRLFRFIFQEKEPPFEVCVVELGEESLSLARRKVSRAREMWRLCLAQDHWPGYPAGVQRIELPALHHERWLERESREEDFRQRHGRDVIEAAIRFQAPEGWRTA